MQNYEIVVRFPRKSKVTTTRYYLDADERRALIEDCGDAAVLLFEYYIRLSSIKDLKPITDQTTADYFGWTKDKVRRLRRALVNKNWFRSSSFRHSNGIKGVTYYLGQEMVAEFDMRSQASASRHASPRPEGPGAQA